MVAKKQYSWGTRITIAAGLVILLLLQWSLWDDRGVLDWYAIDTANQVMRQENDELMQRNAALRSEIDDLKTGVGVLEEKAREDLGMVKPRESFFRTIEVISDGKPSPELKEGQKDE